MYDPDQDTYIIRSESVFYYIATVVVLLYLNLFWIAIFYAYFGIAMVWDDDFETELEDEMVEYESVMMTDSSITEMLGYEFDTEDLESYVETVTEDIAFSNDYPLILDFKHDFNKINNLNLLVKSNSLCSYYNKKRYITSKKQLRNLSFLKLQSKIDLDSFKRELLNKSRLDPADYKKIKEMFKKKQINTEFILSTYIASGLYPSTKYDFDLFKQKLLK